MEIGAGGGQVNRGGGEKRGRGEEGEEAGGRGGGRLVAGGSRLTEERVVQVLLLATHTHDELLFHFGYQLGKNITLPSSQDERNEQSTCSPYLP